MAIGLTPQQYIPLDFHYLFSNYLNPSHTRPPLTYCYHRGIQHDTHAATALLRPHPSTRHVPPVKVLEDISRTKTWSLACHASFYTLPHKDSNGFCTAGIVTSGLKIWGFLVPIEGTMNMQQREAWDDDIFINENQPMDGTRRSVVFLPPGSTMYVYPNSCSLQQLIAILKRSIMPPGLAHEVFTPIASVMIGSHFLTYDTMPATELSMRLEKKKHKFQNK